MVSKISQPDILNIYILTVEENVLYYESKIHRSIMIVLREFMYMVMYKMVWVYKTFSILFDPILLLFQIYVISNLDKTIPRVSCACSVVSDSLWPHGL